MKAQADSLLSFQDELVLTHLLRITAKAVVPTPLPLRGFACWFVLLLCIYQGKEDNLLTEMKDDSEKQIENLTLKLNLNLKHFL